MNFIDAIKSFFSKYAQFSGRARRSEHWYAFLFVQLVSWALSIGLMCTILPSIIALGNGADTMSEQEVVQLLLSSILNPWLLVLMLFGLATLIPTISIQVRRMHDTGRPGAWVWVYWGGYVANVIVPMIGGLIFLAGAIWFIVLACEDSAPGENEYGPNPKGNDTNPNLTEFI